MYLLTLLSRPTGSVFSLIRLCLIIEGLILGMRSNQFQTIQTIKLFEWFESLKV
jgi:hypothetical protein